MFLLLFHLRNTAWKNTERYIGSSSLQQLRSRSAHETCARGPYRHHNRRLRRGRAVAPRRESGQACSNRVTRPEASLPFHPPHGRTHARAWNPKISYYLIHLIRPSSIGSGLYGAHAYRSGDANCRARAVEIGKADLDPAGDDDDGDAGDLITLRV